VSAMDGLTLTLTLTLTAATAATAEMAATEAAANACGGLHQGRDGSQGQGTSSRYEDEETKVSGHLVEREKRNRGRGER